MTAIFMSFFNWVWKKLFGQILISLSFFIGIFGFLFLLAGFGDGGAGFGAFGCGLLMLSTFLIFYGRYQKAHIPVIQQTQQQVIIQQVPQTRQAPVQTMPRVMPPLPPPPIPRPPPKPKLPETPPPPSPPPLPESGLPEGWTMEQWHHYGQEWLDSQK